MKTKYKINRQTIDKFMEKYHFYFIYPELKTMLLAPADKPKEECKHKEQERINPDGKICEKCYQYLPDPTPSKIKSETEKLPELSCDNPIYKIVVVDKINELVERVNLLSAKVKGEI